MYWRMRSRRRMRPHGRRFALLIGRHCRRDGWNGSNHFHGAVTLQ
jgi:hypothetical protein